MRYVRILWSDNAVYGEMESGKIELVATCPDRRRTFKVVNALRATNGNGDNEISHSSNMIPARNIVNLKVVLED